MAANLSQIVLYIQIGKVICSRSEKGAAAAAAEYLHRTYPGIPGFSPRNVRRMRDFYSTYQHSPIAMTAAMELSWTQNVVIFEMCGSEQERIWYIQAACRFRWSKQELISKIESNIYLDADFQPPDDAPSCEQIGVESIAHSPSPFPKTNYSIPYVPYTLSQIFIVCPSQFFICKTATLTVLFLEGRAPPNRFFCARRCTKYG